jgi:hypothetical protein
MFKGGGKSRLGDSKRHKKAMADLSSPPNRRLSFPSSPGKTNKLISIQK